MKKYTATHITLLIILIMITHHGNVFAKLTQLNSTVEVPSIPLPLDRWLPDKEVIVSGMLRSCPGPSAKPDSAQLARYSQEIPICYLNSTAHYKTLEDAMRMCGKFGFPALVILTSKRPGLGWRKTDASRTAPQIPTVEISEEYFFMVNTTYPVTIDFLEGNYAIEFQDSAAWIIEEIVYSMFSFIGIPLLSYAAVAHYAQHGEITLPVIAYSLSALSNIPRFISSLDLYNTRRLYHYCFQRPMWTLPLPMTLSATALFILIEDRVLTKALNYVGKQSIHVRRFSKICFWAFSIFAVATPTFDVIFSIYGCYGGDVQSWTTFPVIGLLVIENLMVMGYSIYMYIRLHRAMSKIQDKPRRKEALNRLKWTRVTLGALSFVWVVFLIFHWFAEGIEDNEAYIDAVLPVGWTGIFFALCMCYVHLFILKLPKTVFLKSVFSDSATGTTQRKSGNSADKHSASGTKKSTTSTSSTLIVSDQHSSIPMEDM